MVVNQGLGPWWLIETLYACGIIGLTAVAGLGVGELLWRRHVKRYRL